MRANPRPPRARCARCRSSRPDAIPAADGGGIALKRGETLGLLALASEDAQRFYPEMGTLYLQRLGEVAAASLLRSAE